MTFSFRPILLAAGCLVGCSGLMLAVAPSALAQGQARPATRPATRTAAPRTTATPANRPVSHQSSPQSSAGVKIAIIDIVRVFQNHPGFNRQLEVVKSEFSNFQKEMVAKRNKVTADQQKLADFVVGSPEYKNADASIMQQVSDMQVSAQLKKKEVQLEEAQIYFGAYNEVQVEVQKIASHYGIDLVLRFDGSTIDPNNPESVMQGVHRPVVYQNGLDITELVLEGLEAKYPPTASATNGAARPATGGAVRR